MDCSLQAPLTVGFSRQEYWSGLPFSSPRDLPHLDIEPVSPALAGGYLSSNQDELILGVLSSLEGSIRIEIPPISPVFSSPDSQHQHQICWEVSMSQSV